MLENPSAKDREHQETHFTDQWNANITWVEQGNCWSAFKNIVFLEARQEDDYSISLNLQVEDFRKT